MNENSTTTVENTRSLFLSTSSDYVNSGGGERVRNRLFDILQTKDTDVRNILTTCVNEEDVVQAFTDASYRNDVDLLQALYDIGVDVNAKEERGDCALTYASDEGHTDSIRWLLDHDANVDVQNDYGWTPLMFASANGKTAAVEMLLKKNANINLQTIGGWTALMRASSSGKLEVIQLLLNHDADTELKDKDGKTALDLAKNEDIKELLLNHVTSQYFLK